MNGHNPPNGGAGPLCKVTLAPSRAGCVFVRSDLRGIRGFQDPNVSTQKWKTQRSTFAQTPPFGQVNGQNPPNGGAGPLCKVTLAPSRAGCVFVRSHLRGGIRGSQDFAGRYAHTHFLHCSVENYKPVLGGKYQFSSAPPPPLTKLPLVGHRHTLAGPCP